MRAPNHLGELVLALPALRRAEALAPDGLWVQVVSGLAPLVAMAGLAARVIPLEDRHALLRESRRLRRLRPARAVLLTPSFSAALLARLGGVPERRGTAGDARRWLLTEPVDRGPLLAGHRVLGYLRLVDPAWSGEEPPAPRLDLPEEARRAWARVAARAGLEPERGPGDGPLRTGLLPGSAAPSRRWPPERFAALARRRVDAGEEVVVLAGAAERAIAARIAEAAPGVVDLAGRTDLPALAGGLASCDAVVANDTGPMHLAAALGRPVVALFGAGDPAQTRPLARRARVVSRPDLPCAPCLRNRCPRRGRGYELPRARLECLRLLAVDRVEDSLMRVRDERPAAEAGGEAR